eukprot:6781321-Pyramimonas_sp.AAC.1
MRDPLVVVIVAGVREFVGVLWAKSITHDVLQSCVVDAKAVLAKASPWGQVRQPVAALFLLLARIRW